MILPILQYADDTIVFIENDIGMSDNLKTIVYWFGETSGLTINEQSAKCTSSGK